MEERVYCERCDFYKGYQCYDGKDYFDICMEGATFVDTPIKREYRGTSCLERNKENNCKQYKWECGQ